MKAHELISLSKPMLDGLLSVGISADDVRFLDMYYDFHSMKSDGLKVTYIVAYLSDAYEVSERKVYSLIKKFDADVRNS